MMCDLVSAKIQVGDNKIDSLNGLEILPEPDLGKITGFQICQSRSRKCL